MSTTNQKERLEELEYKCGWPSCSATYSNPAGLVSHISEEHISLEVRKQKKEAGISVPAGFECEWEGCLCKSRFGSVRDLNRHTASLHLKPVYAPHNCSPATLQVHHDMMVELIAGLRAPKSKLKDGKPSLTPAKKPVTKSTEEKPHTEHRASRSQSSSTNYLSRIAKPLQDARRKLMFNGRQFKCEWKGCNSRCGSKKSFLLHVRNAHLPRKLTGDKTAPCLWRHCPDSHTKFFVRPELDAHLRAHVTSQVMALQKLSTSEKKKGPLGKRKSQDEANTSTTIMNGDSTSHPRLAVSPKKEGFGDQQHTTQTSKKRRGMTKLQSPASSAVTLPLSSRKEGVKQESKNACVLVDGFLFIEWN